MQITPDAVEAGHDQAAVTQVVQAALVRALTRLDLPVTITSEPGRLRVSGTTIGIRMNYPGSAAVTYLAQRAARPGLSTADRKRHGAEVAQLVAEVAEQGQASARRVLNCQCPAWQLDIAPPQWHLRESCERALGQVPPDAGLDGRVDVVDWTEGDRAVYCAASCLLAGAWPQMLAEMATTVRQLCLMQGDALGSFTDFRSHGTIFVNRRRLGPGSTGLPTGVRLAETLVHEATHQRCNAAAVSRPFLFGDADLPLVDTPLRPDPRPLNGLFQQLVVLVRCHMFYSRLANQEGPHGQALHGRRHRIAAQAQRALATVRDHSAALTEHGRDVVAEAGKLLPATTMTGSYL